MSRKRAETSTPTDEASSSPYRLRESSKIPSRYRDDVEISPSKVRSPKKSPSKVAVQTPTRKVNPKRTPTVSSSSSIKTNTTDDSDSKSSLNRKRNEMLMPLPILDDPLHGFFVDDEQPTSSQMIAAPEPREYSRPARRILNMNPTPINMEYSSAVIPRKKLLRSLVRYKYESELGRVVHDNVKRLKNFLKFNKKSRRWVVSEFFYSGVDEQLFLGDNEFAQIIREGFPNLKTLMLNKPEWRTIRRLLGKPRRCSQLFFDEERRTLEMKRSKIRGIYEGTYLHDHSFDISDLPNKLPRPLVVGMRVFALVSSAMEGLYAGTIDALIPNGYRIVFESPNLPPAEVPDTDVIVDGRLELLSLAYFVEQANSKLPTGVRPVVAAVRHLERPHVVKSELDISTNAPMSAAAKRALLNGGTVNIGLEKVGNFPLRFLVILVKLSKLIEVKKKLCRQLSEMNSEAEKMNLQTSHYPEAFKEKYALVIVELDAVNRQIQNYLQSIQEYSNHFTAPNTEPMHLKPEILRRNCDLQASQIVQHCNQGLNVDNRHALSLISSLTSLILQVRTMGQQKISSLDLQSLNEAINEIKTKISPKNGPWFQDHVEVHMKQIHNKMVQQAGISVPSVPLGR
ncbi:unnamed protein product [Caenorhabditis auriculariae]|uniref:DIRP domain-containing protein n=1 Tax=Caenorhabditis auriculariae TaxID=2777116 RepID=A0A8S1HQX7_9PELO|nr:unnamed protein product [Caenorhabditis auriculariae]